MIYRNAIIIEGPDCSGKTTLAKKINEYYNNELDIIHCTGHDPRDFDFYKQLMRKKNVVFDRHFVGEMIYPEIFHRKPELSVEEFNTLVKQTKVLNIPVIIVVPSEDVLVNRLKNERPNEEQEIVETIKMARNKFYNLAKENSSFILIEPEDGNIDVNDIINKIEEFSRRRR